MLLPPLLCIPFSHVCTYDSNDDIVSWLVAASVIDYNAVIDVLMYVTMLVNNISFYSFTCMCWQDMLVKSYGGGVPYMQPGMQPENWGAVLYIFPLL